MYVHLNRDISDMFLGHLVSNTQLICHDSMQAHPMLIMIHTFLMKHKDTNFSALLSNSAELFPKLKHKDSYDYLKPILSSSNCYHWPDLHHY